MRSVRPAGMKHVCAGRAIVRPPGRSYIRCISESPDRAAINVDLALEQHRAYCDALKTLGLDLISLPPLEDYPDSCFVEDAAVVRGDIAVIGRFGVKSRRGEEEDVARVLARHTTVRRVSEGTTLEGGDVLQAEDSVYVGVSRRTSASGAEELAGFLNLNRYRLVVVEGALHLKTLCTYLGKGVILAAESCAWIQEGTGLEVLRASAGESYAANALAVGDTVVLASGFRGTRRMIEQRGFAVRQVDISEFQKGDGGLTCLSIIF